MTEWISYNAHTISCLMIEMVTVINHVHWINALSHSFAFYLFLVVDWICVKLLDCVMSNRFFFLSKSLSKLVNINHIEPIWGGCIIYINRFLVKSSFHIQLYSSPISYSSLPWCVTQHDYVYAFVPSLFHFVFQFNEKSWNTLYSYISLFKIYSCQERVRITLS